LPLIDSLKRLFLRLCNWFWNPNLRERSYYNRLKRFSKYCKIAKSFALVKSGVGSTVSIFVSGIILYILCCSIIHFLKVWETGVYSQRVFWPVVVVFQRGWVFLRGSRSPLWCLCYAIYIWLLSEIPRGFWGLDVA